MEQNNVLPMFVNTIENSYKNILIVGNNSVAERIYQYLTENKKIDVQLVKNYVLEALFVSDDTEIVIFTENKHPMVLKKNGKNVYYVEYEKIVEENDTFPFMDIYNNIVGKLLSEGVRFLIVRTPNLRNYQPKIPLYISMYLYRQISKYLSNRDYIMLKHLKSEELLQEFKAIKTDNLKGYNRVHGNGKFINYDDGWRRVPCAKVIEEDARHIYLFGYCISANPMLSDNETIAANLQRFVGGNYRVCSRGNDGSAINFIMRSVRYKSGDIVILFTSHHDVQPEKMGLDIIDLTNIYLQVPKLWKHITDSSFHIDAFLAKKIAKELSSRVVETTKKVATEFCLGGGEFRAPQISMYNDTYLTEYVSNIMCLRREGYNGAIVMNCNPFTLGHQYLIREAASAVDNLYVFVVQEDRSYFKFSDRFDMVLAGTNDISNVQVIPSGKYMISANTLPGYFDKSHLGNIEVSASNDLELFVAICDVLNISIRFAGTEPKDGFTRSYNKAMQDILPRYGIKFCEIERIGIKEIKSASMVISATIVREYLDRKQFDDLKIMVPESTYDILQGRGYLDKK